MPGNQELYQQEMEAGNEAAWDQDWKAAANAYGRALQQFPDDPEAHLSLGFSLLRAERLNEALRVYKRAYQLTPEDPIPLEKSADVLQKMGRMREAAKQYANVADVYLKQRDIDKAISNWEKATELTPGLVALHSKLAKAYKRIGDRKRAIYHYLMLAYNFSRSADSERAAKAAQYALKLNRNHTEALNALRSAESGAQVKQPTPVKQAEKVRATSEDMAVDWGDLSDIDITTEGAEVSTSEADPLGPMGEAMADSLSMLASHIMMSGGFEVGGVEALQAMEFQRQGLYSEAITAYEKAVGHMSHPALSLNLGALLLLSEQPEDAVKSLQGATQDDGLEVGAYHALGQAYFRQGKYRSGVEYLAQAARLSDLSIAASETDRQEVETVYSALLESNSKRKEKDEALQAVCQRLVNLLSGREWTRRLEDTRYQMVDAEREGGGERVIEFLAEDINEDVPESISKIDRYIRNNNFTLAMDEAQYAIERAPYYLPIHVRMAEIMMLEGRVRQAINKYNTVAKTYRYRGENGRAASILVEVLEKAPLDIDVRNNLINLLEDEGRTDEAIDQYIELGATYRQLGNMDQARRTFAAADRLGEDNDLSVDKLIRIKHQIADIDQIRLNMNQAQRIYETILQLNDSDERARKALVEVNLQLGNQMEGVKQLDELLRLYAKRKQVKNILKLLQGLVRSYPENTGLRSRLAAIYRQLGRKEDAVEQLDNLADLQLDAGLDEDACATIRQIVKLNPPNVEDYQNALAELGC